MTKSVRFMIAVLLCGLAFTAQSQTILVSAGDLTRGLGTVEGYPDHVQLTSFQVGIQAEVTGGKGGAATVGPPNALPIQITKIVDGFSNKLNLNIVSGRAIREMEIIWVYLREGRNAVSHKVELTDVFLTEVMNSSAAECPDGCPLVAESYKMVYKTYRRTVYRQLDTGERRIVNVFTWNIPNNTATVTNN